jgi:hypothetical protein
MTWSKQFSGTSEDIREQVESSDIPQPAKAFIVAAIRNDREEWDVNAHGAHSDHGTQWGANVNAVFTLKPADQRSPRPAAQEPVELKEESGDADPK